MLGLPPSVRLFVSTEVVDGRKGPDSLMTLVRDVLGHDIFEGHPFIFFTRRQDRVRIVYWDRNGIEMRTKRLEQGRYRIDAADDAETRVRPLEAAERGLICGSRAPQTAAWTSI